jgi:hypothetical protein
MVMALMAVAQPKSDPLMLAFMLAFFSYTAWLLWKETR